MTNTLLDNSDSLSLRDSLKTLFTTPNYTEAMIATGYIDIPGMALVYEEMKAFLGRSGTSLKLLIGREPIVRTYQKIDPKENMDFPGDYIHRDLADLKVKPEYESVISLLLTYLSDNSGKLAIKIYGQKDKGREQFLHAKCYIFLGQSVSIGILGSSNFTQKGLEENAELNYVEANTAIVTTEPKPGSPTKGHIYWFKEMWKDGEDWNHLLHEEILHSPIAKKIARKKIFNEIKPIILSPYETYIKFLIDQFGNTIDSNWKTRKKDFLPKDPSFKILDYQIQAVNQAFSIMKKHHGLILADVVGLGKTYVGIMIIKRFLLENGTDRPILIIVPPAIKPSWVSSINRFDANNDFKVTSYIKIITIGSIDHVIGDAVNEREFLEEGAVINGIDMYNFKQNNFALILVDESHRFRNKDTYMYQQLQYLIVQTNPRAYIVLLSATPQNNRPEDLQNQIGLFQIEQRKSTLDTLGEEYGRNLESYFADKKKEFIKLVRKYDEHGNLKISDRIKMDRESLKILFNDIRQRIIEPLVIRRTRGDIEKYFKEDIEKQNLKFPKIREPEKLEYKMSSSLAKLFADTVDIIALPTIQYKNDGNRNKSFDFTDKNERLGYYRYRAIEYLVSKKDQAFYEKHNLKVGGISNYLAKMMEIQLVKRLESSFTAFKESLQNLHQYCQNMITMLDDDCVFICPDIDINAELSLEKQKLHINGIKGCYESIRRRIKRMNWKDNRNRQFIASDFKPEYKEKLENDKRIIGELIDRWKKQSIDPKMNEFLRQLDSVFFNSKYNNPHETDDKKLIIFTESIPTVFFLLENIESTPYEGKALAITAEELDNKREIVAANFDANYDGEKKNDYQILITTDVLAEGVNLHRSNMILNYDSPWNSTRLMQRLGRINRIGSKADFINVYNYYPSSQGDAEINLVERTWNKLQAFHQLFGEDSKIFSEEEELVEHEIIQHEEDEGDTSLKYVEELKQFRKEYPIRYTELENLAGRVLSARKTDSKEIIAQVKNTADEDFYYSLTDKVVFISKMEMLSKLECNKNEKFAQPDSDLYQKSAKSILDYFTVERQNEKVHLRTQYGSKKQRDSALEILSFFVKNASLNDEAKATIQALSKAVKNGNNPLIREINKVSSPTVFSDVDLSSWTKYLTSGIIKDDETGIVTLTMEYQNEQ